jgi:hypothetical protein
MFLEIMIGTTPTIALKNTLAYAGWCGLCFLMPVVYHFACHH